MTSYAVIDAKIAERIWREHPPRFHVCELVFGPFAYAPAIRVEVADDFADLLRICAPLTVVATLRTPNAAYYAREPIKVIDGRKRLEITSDQVVAEFKIG